MYWLLAPWGRSHQWTLVRGTSCGVGSSLFKTLASTLDAPALQAVLVLYLVFVVLALIDLRRLGIQSNLFQVKSGKGLVVSQVPVPSIAGRCLCVCACINNLTLK